MTVFDSLPSGSMLEAPEGYGARRRQQEQSDARDDMDAKVIAAGGAIKRDSLKSRGLRPGRLLGRKQELSWYVIPEDQFDRP
jgi:hypothetical protein